jgi:hypothetical protein
MKKCILIVLLFLMAIFKATSVEKYNYYLRNNDGTFIMKNIDEKDINFFSYFLSKDNNNETVTGYYYNTNNVKFIVQ